MRKEYKLFFIYGLLLVVSNLIFKIKVIYDNHLRKYTDNNNITLDEPLVALKLLYSKNTIHKKGYERAKSIIEEFNAEKKLNLKLMKLIILCIKK